VHGAEVSNSRKTEGAPSEDHDQVPEQQEARPAIEILDVSTSREDADLLLGGRLDRPKKGDKLEARAVPISGWVLPKAGPAIAVEVVYGTRIIRKASVAEPRPDVARARPETEYADRCGFYTLVGVLGLTPEFELGIRVVMSDGARIALGSFKARHAPLSTHFEPTLQPIMLTSIARTGTTWLMKLLSAHPQIVAFPRHPYEVGVAGYWTHALKVLSDPADFVLSSHPDNYLSDLWHVGHNPFYTRARVEYDDPVFGNWLGGPHVYRLATFFQQSIDDWYRLVVESQGKDRAVRFVEKNVPGHVPVLMNELYPKAKEIFLVRDFRDMASSMFAFNKKRGYDAFGAEGRTSEEFIRQNLRGDVLALQRAWEARKETSFLLRYEDLVRRPIEALTRVLEHLGLDSSNETVESMLGSTSEETIESRGHVTAPSAEASIGRWTQEDEGVRILYEEAFREPLAAFGYLVASSGDADGEVDHKGGASERH
jgi:hypothetical protein